jgi:hypothetical protein
MATRNTIEDVAHQTGGMDADTGQSLAEVAQVPVNGHGTTFGGAR